MRNIQTAVSAHPLKNGHNEIIYSDYSIVRYPKIFTIPPETSCTYIGSLAIIHFARLFMRNIQTAVSAQPSKIRHMFV